MVPGKKILGLDLELPTQQWQVPFVLVALVALVAQVLKHEIAPPDGPPVLGGHPLDGGHHLLVDHPVEPDAQIVPPQAELAIGRGVDPRPKQHPERDLIGVRQERLEMPSVRVDQPFVGVYVEDPLPAGVVQRDIARLCEVVPPGMVNEVDTEASGDLGCRVDRPGVNEHHLVNDARQRLETPCEELFLIARDENGREQRLRWAYAHV